MNKLALIAAFALISLPVAAHANDHAAPAAPAPAAAAVEATTTVAAKEATLKDGTKVMIDGETVSVVAADGTKSPALDGDHELADGSKLTIKDGKLVTAAPATEMPSEAHKMEAPKMEAPKMEAPAEATKH